MDLAIIPECYIDTNLVETLVPPRQQGYNHQHGCGTVASVMIKKFSDDFAVGIIDKDKDAINYLQEFTTVSAKGNVELLKHKTKNHYFIQVKPAMERFILHNVGLTGINLSEYGLPADFESFKNLTKTTDSKKDYRFKSLFKALKRAGTADFNLLTAWIDYLVSHPYDADIETLRDM